MGDVHNNRFGGPNNVFTDRNKKNNTNNTNKNRKEPNKLLGIFIAGVFTFGLATAGLDGLADVASSVVDTVKDLADIDSADSTHSEIDDKNIKNDSGIDDETLEKLKDALENITDETNIPEKITILKYKHLKNEKTFKKQVDRAFKRVRKETMYVYAVSKDFGSQEEIDAEKDRTKKMFSKMFKDLNREYLSNDKTPKVGSSSYGAIQIDDHRVIFFVVYKPL